VQNLKINNGQKDGDKIKTWINKNTCLKKNLELLVGKKSKRLYTSVYKVCIRKSKSEISVFLHSTNKVQNKAG